jgi:SPP1 family phage portal protein
MAWGYRTSEQNGDTAYHFDLFTKDKCLRCTNVSDGWQVIEEENKIGKIPFILFEQEKEWEGVESLLHREEYIASKTADNNDYFSDPIAVVSADVVKSMPDKGMAGRLMITDSAEGVDKALKYVTWDSAPQSKTAELEWLQKQILTKTFTPQIDFETMKGLSNVSGKALKQMMLLADIKASKRKETHDDLLSRSASLILAIMANVTDITLSPEIAKLEVQHEFQEPFGEDIASAIGNIVSTIEAGILSKEAGIELNPLVKDPTSEKERIKKEAEEEGGFENIFGNQQERKALSFVS